jgi:two-component system sensor histidine kinase TorS
MGGQIELGRTLGKGTRIWFQLPFELSGQDELTHPVESYIRPSAQTVLMVEDDPTIREVTHNYLTHSGHTVVAINDGEAALAYLKKTIPDLILLDVSLPGVSGLDVLKKIRASNNPAIKNIAVIAMSAHVFDEEVATYLSAGMDGFLGKPFSWEDLDRSISQVQTSANKPVTKGKYHQQKHNLHNWKHAPLIEESVMKDDIALLGHDRVVQLLNILKSSGQEYLDQFSALKDQKTIGENSDVADIAHRMRSASGNFGFVRLSALLHYIEKSDKDCFELLPDVRALFQASIKAADELLERV